MTSEINNDELNGWVSLERGEVDRRIFADDEIFEREIELIFGRPWQFLCHETQIPKPGDFFETPLGVTMSSPCGSGTARSRLC